MAKHLFSKENPTPGPGRPRGSTSDKTIAINIIFKVFSDHGVKEFEKQMSELCKQKPVAFYERFIQPIQPKQFDIDGDLCIRQILVERFKK